ncbi:sigma-54-dependent transcriptional regulator [Occallatibacter riparius]|uniref:Sigma-54 dependent transcriptional regulator n=1 Tax=Occallatibacter riparius TaxID=1002689 RepID=A0A9J7BWY6_9BACT|nr:sigma-54 dependent transcriptional regulator [Occallatibacter riparius]UWZ85398.1 sigma-54 dependent transcriptional regulator [Occallatibacter riparius]
MPASSILVVDDDASVRRVLQMQLVEAGYTVATAQSGTEARKLLVESRPKLVITDLRMPGLDGIELLRLIADDQIQTTVIMITAFGSIETAVQAMRLGAYDYITKPIDYEALLLAVQRAMERQDLIDEVRNLRSALDRRYGFENIIGHSESLLRVLELASRVAQHDSTVLIQGETGTGKELLARAIHYNSRRRNQPFVTINCGAIPRDLIESELFGHSRGSFTGAVANKPGRIEMADNGTLFLDEIGELPLESQVKLLRVIQHGEIERVGGSAPKTVNVRIIAATHRNLAAMVEDAAFRQDLFYRLAVVPLRLPPLRERRQDIPELLEHLFRQARERHNMPNIRMAPSLVGLFAAYRWPGNIRELENIIERMLVLSNGEIITENDLPEELRQASLPQQRATLLLELPDEGISLEAVERELLLRALEKFDGNQTHAARYLDISRRTFIYRMEKHGLRQEDLTR